MARRSDHTRAELKQLALESAREIVREEGVSALSTRKLAKEIGYTSGTLYQIFKNRDDLGDQLNIETVKQLFEFCKDIPIDRPPDELLRGLAENFVIFASTHSSEWDAVINYPFTPDYQPSEAYNGWIEKLMGLIHTCTNELYGTEAQDLQRRDAQLLWHSLYGIFALASAGRISRNRTIAEMVDDLIEMFLAARM